MAQKRAILAAIGCLVAVGFASPCDARIVRFVVEQTRSFASGMSFGDVCGGSGFLDSRIS